MTFVVYFSGELIVSEEPEQEPIFITMLPFAVTVLEPLHIVDNTAPYFEALPPSILLSPGTGKTISLGSLIDDESNEMEIIEDSLVNTVSGKELGWSELDATDFTNL